MKKNINENAEVQSLVADLADLLVEELLNRGAYGIDGSFSRKIYDTMIPTKFELLRGKYKIPSYRNKFNIENNLLSEFTQLRMYFANIKGLAGFKEESLIFSEMVLDMLNNIYTKFKDSKIVSFDEFAEDSYDVEEFRYIMRPILIHELQHFHDHFISKGKFSKKYDDPNSKYYFDKSLPNEKEYGKYFASDHEVNARLTDALNSVSLDKSKDDFIKTVLTQIDHYNKLSEKKRKKLVNKIINFYDYKNNISDNLVSKIVNEVFSNFINNK